MIKKINTEIENMKYENRQIIKNTKFDYVITLNIRNYMPLPSFKKLVYEFQRRLNKKLFGKNWRKICKEIIWLHNYELKSNNTHTHSVCNLNEYDDVTNFKRQARHIWAKLNNQNPNKQIYIDKFTKSGAVANYITKENNCDFSFV